MESVNAAQSALRTLGSMIHTRLEMFSLETSIEKKRIFLVVALSTLAAGLALLTLVITFIFTLLVTPAEIRVYVALGWILLTGLLTMLCFAATWFAVVKGKAPFAYTREEIRKDIACFGTTMNSDD